MSISILIYIILSVFCQSSLKSIAFFQTAVNGIMGISPIEYIKNYRLNKAKSFIQSGMSFSEVAFAVGFSDPGYFGKAFKKAFNQTLTEYKNNN